MNSNEDVLLQNAHRVVLELAENIKPVVECPLEISSQELALNLSILLRAKGPLLPQDAEAYRELIIGLNEKLKVLQISLERLQDISNLNQKILSDKEVTEKSQLNAISKLEAINKLQQQENFKILQEKNQILVKLNEKTKKLEESRTSHQEKDFKIEKLSAEVEVYKNLSKKYSENPNDPNFINDYSKEFESLKSQLQNSLEAIELIRAQSEKDCQGLIDQNNLLLNEIKAANKDLQNLKNDQSDQMTEIADLKSLLNFQEIEIAGYKLLESNYESLQSYNQDLKSQNELYQKSIENLRSDNKKLNSEICLAKEKADHEISLLSNKILQNESQIQTQSLKIKQKDEDLINQNRENSILSKKINDLNSNSEFLSNTLSNFQKELFESQRKTESELEFVSNYCLKSSQDHLDQDRSLKKLGDIINEKDIELSILREMIGELQKPKPSYFPIKDDPVDQALAEFLNSRPEPLEVNFIREDQGTYLFGSKRVFIKIENGKIISNL
jgi:hypothetical protein